MCDHIKYPLLNEVVNKTQCVQSAAYFPTYIAHIAQCHACMWECNDTCYKDGIC